MTVEVYKRLQTKGANRVQLNDYDRLNQLVSVKIELKVERRAVLS